ncbi:MAG: hypothetical protein IT461_02425 [Planctomycetes bacterium]|nr:hypothetical protein [Planctomycetota bacterium]
MGQYYAWNRTYDINTGRWTTPDPVATPWTNLQEYVGNNSTQRHDSRGLDDADDLDGKSAQEVKDALRDAAESDKTLFPELAKALNRWLDGTGSDRDLEWDWIMHNKAASNAQEEIQDELKEKAEALGNSLSCNTSGTKSGSGKKSVNAKPDITGFGLAWIFAPVTGPITPAIQAYLLASYRHQFEVFLVLGRFNIDYEYTIKAEKKCWTDTYLWCIDIDKCEISYTIDVKYSIKDKYDYNPGDRFKDPFGGWLRDWKADNMNKAKDVGAKDYYTKSSHSETISGETSCDD